MAIATFDTLKFANTLKAAGVPSQQAEAQAAAFAEVIQLNFQQLVTKEDADRNAKAAKEDLDRTAKELRNEIAEVKKELKHDIKELEHRLTHRIDLLAAKTEMTAVILRGAVNLLRWLVGVNATVILMTLGFALRYFIIRGIP